MGNRRSSDGFTITELLAVIVILAILAGILFPIFGRSVRRAKLGSEIEHLRQIGLAAAQYAETTGRHPLAVNGFEGTDLWKSPLWAGDADPHKNGFRNVVLSAFANGNGNGFTKHYAERIVPFKVSFVGYDDVFDGLEKERTTLLEHPSAGWLISFDEQDIGSLADPREATEGAFTRLNFDGSVVHRNSQKDRGQLSYFWLFRDTGAEDKEKERMK